MKRIIAIAVIGWLLLAGSVWASQVTNVALTYEDGRTVARIDVQGPVRFIHQTEVPKDGRPDRVIVDVLSATHELGAREFLSLPSCVVTGIRSSQYAVSPEKIVRIVFDVSTTPVYQVESDDHSIMIKFNYQEAQSFAAWSSNPAKPAPIQVKPAEPKVEPPQMAVVAPTPVSVAAQNKIIENDRLASLTEKTLEKPKVEKTVEPARAVTAPALPEEPVEWAKPTGSSSDGLAFTNGWETPQNWKPKSPTVFPSAGAPSNATPPVTVAKAPAPVVPEPQLSISPAPEKAPIVEQPEPKPVVEEAKEKLAVQAPEVKPETAPVADEPTFPPVSDEFVYPPLQAPFTLAQQSAAQPEKPKETAEAPAPVEPTPVLAQAETEPAVQPNETADAEPVAEPSIDKAKLLDEADFAPAVELPATVKPEDMSGVVMAETAAPEADKTPQRATARFRREAQSDKIRGSMVAAFPERLVIQYQTERERDPFDPLIDDTKSFNNPVENRIPNVEGLKLVGILESETGNNRALFEDKGGFSYILQSGDKVRNGYVLRVEPDQVYFQIFEYGWSRTVALTMEY